MTSPDPDPSETQELSGQTVVSELAPAKVNLTLHVTGRRADGYHLLDSLVVFAAGPEAADRITVRRASGLSLIVRGPKARDTPADGDNLVLRAAALMQGAGQGAEIVLDKVLPVASGIGGGSSDAAATWRALARLWERRMPSERAALALGADLPVCCRGQAARMSGIGEEIAPVAGLPALPAVLVNPGVPVATPDVFAGLAQRTNAPMPPVLPSFSHVGDAAAWLATQRNDLETPARALVPEVTAALEALYSSEGCLLARMSGSGATCFGLFADRAAANAAAARITARAPQWWVAATVLA